MTLLPKWLREYADEMWEEARELSPPCLLMIGFAYEAATEIERLESENRRLKSLVENPRSQPCPMT